MHLVHVLLVEALEEVSAEELSEVSAGNSESASAGFKLPDESSNGLNSDSFDQNAEVVESDDGSPGSSAHGDSEVSEHGLVDVVGSSDESGDHDVDSVLVGLDAPFGDGSSGASNSEVLGVVGSDAVDLDPLTVDLLHVEVDLGDTVELFGSVLDDVVSVDTDEVSGVESLTESSVVLGDPFDVPVVLNELLGVGDVLGGSLDVSVESLEDGVVLLVEVGVSSLGAFPGGAASGVSGSTGFADSGHSSGVDGSVVGESSGSDTLKSEEVGVVPGSVGLQESLVSGDKSGSSAGPGSGDFLETSGVSLLGGLDGGVVSLLGQVPGLEESLQVVVSSLQDSLGFLVVESVESA